MSSVQPLLDAAGRRPSPATTPVFRPGVAPRNKGQRTPPTRRLSMRSSRAVVLMHEGVPPPIIERQLGHSHLSTTGTYLEGINTAEIISTVHARQAPLMHASAGLAL